MFLEQDSETTWNDSYTYSGHVSGGGQRNYLKWQLYLFKPCFLRKTANLPEMTAVCIMRGTAKLPEMTAIPSMAMCLEEDSWTTWNDCYTYYKHISSGGQRNYLKWQLYLSRPCYLKRTAKLPEMTAIPIMAIFLVQESETNLNVSYTYYGHVSWGGQWNYLELHLYLLWPCFLSRTAKLPGMTVIAILALFLEETETTWNDSYTYYGHVSWGY